MILHLAIFTWKDDVTEEDITGVTTALLEMAEKIDVLRSYRAGPNLRVRPGGDFAVAAVVDDPASLNAYLDHPLHAEVYERFLGRMIDQRMAAQLPYDGPTES